MGNLLISKWSWTQFTDVAVLKLKVHKTNAKIKNTFCKSASIEINPFLYLCYVMRRGYCLGS